MKKRSDREVITIFNLVIIYMSDLLRKNTFLFCGAESYGFHRRISGLPRVVLAAKVLQDLRCAVATPEFEARLAEMRKVGEARTWEGIELGSPQQKLEIGRFLKLVAC